MNSPSWPDVTNARETEEKRKGKSKIEKPDSDVNAEKTETTDCVAFWDREIPEMNTLLYITQPKDQILRPSQYPIAPSLSRSVGREKKRKKNEHFYFCILNLTFNL